MSVCAVEGCTSTSGKNPKLCFYDVPKDFHVRDKWLKLLDPKIRACDTAKVCELHFRWSDFNTKIKDKKVLKCRAVPCASIEEAMHCDSDSDLEVVNLEDDRSMDVKPPSPGEIETPSRRPSRRAAQVAAQKIQDTVRSYSMNTDELIKCQLQELEDKARKSQASQRLQTYHKRDKMRAWHSIRAPLPENIDLTMECYEELLSVSQAEALMQSQAEYNAVMKRLRTLKASNARIICTDYDNDSFEFKPVTYVPTNSRQCNVVTMTPVSNNSVTIVPVHLVTVQPNQIPFSKPASPAVNAVSVTPVPPASDTIKFSTKNCLVCGSTGPGLHSLPKQFEKSKQWIKLIDRQDIFLKPNWFTYTYNNGRICTKHFADWCFTGTDKKTLIFGAMPCMQECPTKQISLLRPAVHTLAKSVSM